MGNCAAVPDTGREYETYFSTENEIPVHQDNAFYERSGIMRLPNVGGDEFVRAESSTMMLMVRIDQIRVRNIGNFNNIFCTIKFGDLEPCVTQRIHSEGASWRNVFSFQYVAHKGIQSLKSKSMSILVYSHNKSKEKDVLVGRCSLNIYALAQGPFHIDHVLLNEKNNTAGRISLNCSIDVFGTWGVDLRSATVQFIDNEFVDPSEVRHYFLLTSKSNETSEDVYRSNYQYFPITTEVYNSTNTDYASSLTLTWSSDDLCTIQQTCNFREFTHNPIHFQLQFARGNEKELGPVVGEAWMSMDRAYSLFCKQSEHPCQLQFHLMSNDMLKGILTLEYRFTDVCLLSQLLSGVHSERGISTGSTVIIHDATRSMFHKESVDLPVQVQEIVRLYQHYLSLTTPSTTPSSSGSNAQGSEKEQVDILDRLLGFLRYSDKDSMVAYSYRSESALTQTKHILLDILDSLTHSLFQLVYSVRFIVYEVIFRLLKRAELSDLYLLGFDPMLIAAGSCTPSQSDLEFASLLRQVLLRLLKSVLERVNDRGISQRLSVFCARIISLAMFRLPSFGRCVMDVLWDPVIEKSVRQTGSTPVSFTHSPSSSSSSPPPPHTLSLTPSLSSLESRKSAGVVFGVKRLKRPKKSILFKTNRGNRGNEERVSELMESDASIESDGSVSEGSMSASSSCSSLSTLSEGSETSTDSLTHSLTHSKSPRTVDVATPDEFSSPSLSGGNKNGFFVETGNESGDGEVVFIENDNKISVSRSPSLVYSLDWLMFVSSAVGCDSSAYQDNQTDLLSLLIDWRPVEQMVIQYDLTHSLTHSHSHTSSSKPHYTHFTLSSSTNETPEKAQNPVDGPLEELPPKVPEDFFLYENGWKDRLKLRGNIYYLLIEAWLQKVLSVMSSMQCEIKWFRIPVYRELLLSFIYQLEATPLSSYTDSMTKVLQSFLCNPSLLPLFVRILLLKTHCYSVMEVSFTFELVDSLFRSYRRWMERLERGRHPRQLSRLPVLLPIEFADEPLVSSIVTQLSSDLNQVVLKVLEFLYHQWEMLRPSMKHSLLCYFMQYDNMVRLFLHWSVHVRQFYFHFVVYCLLDNESMSIEKDEKRIDVASLLRGFISYLGTRSSYSGAFPLKYPFSISSSHGRVTHSSLTYSVVDVTYALTNEQSPLTRPPRNFDSLVFFTYDQFVEFSLQFPQQPMSKELIGRVFDLLKKLPLIFQVMRNDQMTNEYVCSIPCVRSISRLFVSSDSVMDVDQKHLTHSILNFKYNCFIRYMHRLAHDLFSNQQPILEGIQLSLSSSLHHCGGEVIQKCNSQKQYIERLLNTLHNSNLSLTNTRLIDLIALNDCCVPKPHQMAYVMPAISMFDEIRKKRELDISTNNQSSPYLHWQTVPPSNPLSGKD